MTRHPAPASPVRHDDVAAHGIAAHGMRRVADLQVHVRQSHGDRDPAALGRPVVAGADA